MKGLVVGCGSIGKRHLQNLKLLGVSKLGVVESDELRREVVVRELGAESFAQLASGLGWAPDFVVIATPPSLHLAQSLQAASSGCAVFIEKPLSHTLLGISELLRAIENQSLISMVGCNMRFHPGPAK